MTAGAAPSVSELLRQHYLQTGLPQAAWHLGPEHPAIERFAIERLRGMQGKRVLEIGVQAAGFGVPVVDALHREPGFSYTGVENHAYPNAVPFSVIETFLRVRGVSSSATFVESDGTAFLRKADPGAFDMILLDHYKPLYPVSVLEICSRRLLETGGVVLCHDVLGNARDIWPICVSIGRLYGLEASVHAEVPEGVGELRLRGAYRTAAPLQVFAWRIRVAAAWRLHNAVRTSRESAGRLLRAVGLR